MNHDWWVDLFFNIRHLAKTVPRRSSTCDQDWQFECSNKRCIPLTLVCDLVDHCGDRSDEKFEFCSKRVCHSTHMFRCNSGQCINKLMQCNRMFECKDKSDEVSCDDGKYKKFLKKSGGVIWCTRWKQLTIHFFTYNIIFW